MEQQTGEKYRKLREIIGEWDRCVIAFSGGCDSGFLLGSAVDVLGAEKVLAVTARSPSFPEHEWQHARKAAAEFGVEHEELATNELNDPNFSNNPPNRCYYCKRELFGRVLDIAGRRDFPVVAEASNYDDANNDYRPGLIAIKELGIRSPLIEAGLTKSEVREISRRLALATHDRPSFACLASRFPYGEKITATKLDRVAGAERIMRQWGFKQFRVRSHGNIARIELGPDEREDVLLGDGKETIVDKLKQLGYVYVTFDMEGYRTGSMNEAIGEML